MDWKDYGLEDPNLKIAMGLKDGRSLDLELGDKDFNQSLAFSAGFHTRPRCWCCPRCSIPLSTRNCSISGTSRCWILNREQVREVAGPLEAQDLPVAEGGRGIGLIREPIQARADRSEIRSFLSDLEFARVEEFLERGAGGLKTYGLNAPSSRIDLYLGENRARKNTAGRQTGRRPILRQG